MEGMPRSTGYTNNSPAQPNQESSSSKLLLPTTDKRRNIESGGILSPTQTRTLDQCHHQFNAQLNQHKQRQRGRALNQDPDQPQLASATTAGASNSNTPPSQAPSEANHVVANSIRYRECLKNHAASIGGHVVDGCGEFMPSGDEGTTEALKCAACKCHRNFHRRESQGGESQQLMSSFYHAHNHNGNNRIRKTTNHHIQPPSSQQYPHPHPHHPHQFLHHYSHSLASPTTGGSMMMAFGGAGTVPAESSSEDLNMFHSSAREAQPMAAVPPSFSVSKKRFRTKFSKEQKDRMHEVAEKLGWKIQKQDDEQVQKLCDEMGVKRQVFKVWMHNNKQAMKKKQHE